VPVNSDQAEGVALATFFLCTGLLAILEANGQLIPKDVDAVFTQAKEGVASGLFAVNQAVLSRAVAVLTTAELARRNS